MTRTLPTTGIVRWTYTAANGNPHLWIQPRGGEGHDYELVEVQGGYDLVRWDERTERMIRYQVRIVTSRYWSCTCPDHKNRHRRCKHIGAVRAALKAQPF